MVMDSFTKLDVWQKSHDLTINIYRTTRTFPQDEKYRLGDQLRRSASSIPANIAEGKGRKTLKEYITFLYNARGSLEETKYHLLLANDLDYLSHDKFDKLADVANTVGKMLNGLINSLEEKDNA